MEIVGFDPHPSYQVDRKFCSQSCAASFNNKGIRRHGKSPGKCLLCHKTLKRQSAKYCSQKCQCEYQYLQYIQEWKVGKKSGLISGNYMSQHVRRYILDKYKHKCCKCGWDKPNPITGKPFLEIHHIDGNCLNNNEDNLELLCPNCHSLTTTYMAINNGNGNQDRLTYTNRR